LYATEGAESRIQAEIRKHPALNARLHVCHFLTEEDCAFPSSGFGFWSDEQTRDRAKALCSRLAAGLYKEPLGVGAQGLLVAFPDTCPNNNLPIIFASRGGSAPWQPLLERPPS
jgi:hypothetical protein